MTRLLYRLGGAAAAHPWRTIATWLILLVAGFSIAGAAGGTLHDNYNVPGAPSQAGADLLTSRFPDRSGADARVVLHDRAGNRIDTGVLTAVDQRLSTLDHVTAVSPPQLTSRGDTALLSIQYDVPVTTFKGSAGADALRGAVQPAERAGLQAELGGQVPENISKPSGTAEAVGFIAALVILVLAFGSIVAAGVPLAVAIIGLGVGTSAIGVLSALMDVSTIAPTIASMVGIGVGIDYALLLVTRHVEALRRGLPVREAAAEATATAGASVVFAGLTVLASLLGLRLASLPVYSSFGYATALVVLAVMLTAITLVPALCGLAGMRLLRKRDRGVVQAPAVAAQHGAATARWAARVGRHPLPWALGALAVLLTLAAPVLGMRTWPQNAGSQPDSNTTRRAYDLIAAEYGVGANGPFLIAVDLNQVTQSQLPALQRKLTSQPGVAAVSPPLLNQNGDAAILTLQPTTAPEDKVTTDLLHRLRGEVLPSGAHVTGLTPTFADISQRLSDRLWLVIGFVVALALILLTAVFRSVVVAIKAAVMNLLSVAAAYGVMTAIFQWGWGATLLGLPHAVPVSSWVPILMFAILFGLSMDYEVFLLSRVREDWLETGDPHGSVVRGLARTGRVITSAAAIMVAVFVGFALDPDVTVKMTGVGMATAVFLDATVTRMVLVPATMAMLGKLNWWLPGWLDRLLPHLGDHTTAPTPQLPSAERDEVLTAR
jgi:RND superfamily putative drug exporter